VSSAEEISGKPDSMKIEIPLKDVMIVPGKRFDPSESSAPGCDRKDQEVYGVIAGGNGYLNPRGMVSVEFRDARLRNSPRPWRS